MASSGASRHKYILEKAKRYCAYQERSVFEMKKKLHEWKVRPEAEKKIIAALVKENYLNDERFAKVYAGGKFRIKKWGRNKIKNELRARRIPDSLIQSGLEEIDENEYLKVLQEIIEKKKLSFINVDNIDVKQKIYNFALAKGFERHLILNLI